MLNFIPLISFPLGPEEGINHSSTICISLGSSLIGDGEGAAACAPSSHSGSAQLHFDKELDFSRIPSHTHIFLLHCISSDSLRLWHWFPTGRHSCFRFSVD